MDKNRLRWHCRRGLLELDLIFARFLSTRFEALDTQQIAALEALLQFEDTDLWEMVSGRAQCERTDLAELVSLLRTA